ncbi:MAG: xanthine dehydrogenase family protein subunit M [Betaproteobacteria bacterium]|nr:xanthine dehydrogenase family protein subunit M [Betaproteobacteria bacterium]
MKPAPFSYLRPESLAAAAEALRRHGPDARILAGGQSLVPMMALRVAQPTVLVDIGRIAELRGLTRNEHALWPLLSLALRHVAHAAIRNRGTLGGSLALADPAAELPACALALDAVMHIHGSLGTRVVSAADFFLGLYSTAVGDGEILTAVEFPVSAAGEQVFFDEISRRRGDYAIAGLAAIARADHTLRLSFLGCGDRPMRAPHAEALAAEAHRSTRVPDRLQLKAALAADLDPPSDLQASADTRLHLAAVLVERALRSWSAPSNAFLQEKV